MIEDEFGIEYLEGNSKRFYKIDITIKRYDLENTTPYLFRMGKYEIKNNSWGGMLYEIACLLNKIDPKSRDELLMIKADWGKQSVFSVENKTNFKIFQHGLYINLNHTSIHAMWTIQLLLNEWMIPLENCEMYIHRMPKAERAEVIEYYTKKTISGMETHLGLTTSLSKDAIEKYINLLREINEKLCPKVFNNSGYNNIFVIDEFYLFETMRKKLVNRINVVFSDKVYVRKNAQQALEYLRQYYKRILR